MICHKIVDESLGVTDYIVARLATTMKKFGEELYVLYDDNYFSSMGLLKFLKTNNVFYTGNLRENRVKATQNLLKEKDLKKLGRGEYLFCYCLQSS